MSWKVVNRILSQAAISPTFCQRLQEDLLVALDEEGYELTPEEIEALRTFGSLPFPAFCQRLLDEFGPDVDTQ